MDKIKKLLVIFCSIIVVLVLVIIILKIINKNNRNNTDEAEIPEIEQQSTYEVNTELQEVKNYNKYFAVQEIITTYITNLKNVEYQKTTDELKKEYAISNIQLMTNQNYTPEEISRMAKKYPLDKDNKLVIDSMLMSEKTVNINVFIVECKIAGIKTKLSVKTDSLNSSYILYTEDYINEFKTIDLFIEAIDDSEIENNEYNELVYKNITDEYVAINYVKQYLQYMLNDVEKAYDILDEEYRNKRFGDINNFKEYVKDNQEEFQKINIKQYLVNSYNDYKEYVCKDQYENLYIFKETGIMKYIVALDTYTIEQEQFTNTYKNANDNKKVVMNIDKFIQMLNRRDYKTSYHLLDDGFKNNYFKTQNDFERYIRENYPLHYKVAYEEISKQGDIYIQPIELTDITGENKETKKMSIIMKLEKESDFIMSFSIE